MKRVISKISAYLCFAVLWITSIFPMWAHYLFSDALYFLLYHVVGYRRRIVRGNISSAFPEKSEAEVRQVEREFYHWFCDYLVET
ncbi:MAG: acetyltransferase, partial [Prevotella sp.]|nr:acetyltransferase [Prevotella sp.]